MTTIKIFAIVVAWLLVLLVSWLTNVDVRDIMTIVAFVGVINLLTSKWVSIIYLREMMRNKDKE